ncbi:alpha/beta hydrolase fold family protein [Pseudomonas sp. BAY1663]|uniref:2-hydroxy-6-ketonona-2,4-dienedioic acid hydrolase n=1 Tax=Stutzerimonas stutzeri TaxID=316 RepID=A0A2N8T280_STUST|nr:MULTISPECIES: alpha/beta hydrolase [Pseudomonadaceae]EXF45032.1 alpha/beta hydrolase fold family protein [Pseudomonas sp. BAY1663]MCQ4324253.1 alpha/beta fold hydrolase [Stutzerimonas stutzeri]PNG08845.1 2-hydroxy-6-ketonona-2,4-dienedioic acid hydrolase [Stutzerimonas stutzeri]
MSYLTPSDSQFVAVDGVRLHYQVLGRDTGRLPILFTHGGGPGSTAWSNFRLSAGAFAADHRCYFVDLPQFGRSAMVPVQGPLFGWHASKLLGLMDALGIARAHLINQSFGGCVALRLAVDHPQRVGRLVTIGSQPVDQGAMAPLPLFSKHAATLMSDYYLADGGPTPDKLRRLLQRYELHDDSRLDEENLRLRFEASDNPDYIRLLQTPGAFGEWENLLPELHRVRAPTLMCWGLHDWFGSIDVPMMMLNRLPGAQLHVFGNAAHHLQSECPDEFNALAISFIGAA